MPSSTAQVTELDPLHIGLGVASQLADLDFRLFRSEAYTQIVFDPVYRSATEPTPQHLKNRLDRILKVNVLEMWARFSRVNTKTIVLYKDEEIVGFSHWQLPREMMVRGPWWHRIKLKLILLAARLLHWIWFGNETYQPLRKDYPPLADFLETVHISKPIPVKQLADVSGDSRQLAKYPYPMEKLMWCSRMGIDSRFRSQGLGRLLFQHALHKLPKYQPIFESDGIQFQAPTMYALNATDAGRPFYTSLGFQEVGRYSGDIQGTPISITPMALVLEPGGRQL